MARIASNWRRFDTLRATGALNRVGFTRAAVLSDQQVVNELSNVFARLADTTNPESRVELAQADASHEKATGTFQRSLWLLVGIVSVALGAGLACVILLTRNIVPRIRSYAHFAQQVSSGDLSARLHPRGQDEIAQLGQALNEMVSNRQADETQAVGHAEFTQLAQAAEAEDEAYELLRRQIERTIPGSSAAILNGNNSDDRLEPATTLPEASPLLEPLLGAQPRACLAVRFGRSHQEGPDRQPLLSCEVCGNNGFATCEPLLCYRIDIDG